MLPTRRDATQDDYHGTLVDDPYRWLEDPASEETQAFVAAQNTTTQEFLAKTGLRSELTKRLTELLDFPKWSAPTRRGTRYFFGMNSGLQNQSVVYLQDGLAGEPHVLIDPNLLSTDGTASLTSQSLSRDGAWFAYGVSQSGSDWQQLHIRNVNDGTDLAETIRWCKFAFASWRPDGSGFYYARFPESGTVAPEDESNFQRVYWHRLGTAQDADTLVYERPDAKELAFEPLVTDDGAYVVLIVGHGTDAQNRIYYRPLDSNADFTRLLDDADAGYDFIGNDGPIFFFKTTLVVHPLSI